MAELDRLLILKGDLTGLGIGRQPHIGVYRDGFAHGTLIRTSRYHPTEGSGPAGCPNKPRGAAKSIETLWMEPTSTGATCRRRGALRIAV
jgi:hypothetical protein